MSTLLKEILRTKEGAFLTLKDMCKPILVPCFDLNSSAPFVFSRADASQSPSYDFELWKVIRATLATPPLFKPFSLTSIDGKTSCLAIDGGIVMNNPASAVITHVLHNKRDFPSVNRVEDLAVLSLGNGCLSNHFRRPKLSRNGDCLTSAIVDIAMDGISETVDQMVANAFGWNCLYYVRIQTYDSFGNDEEQRMIAEEKGVETLPFGGKKLLTETNGQRIEGFVQRLTTVSGSGKDR